MKMKKIVPLAVVITVCAGGVAVLAIFCRAEVGSGEQQLQKLVVARMALLEYAGRHGSFPADLKALEGEGLLPTGYTQGFGDLYRASGQPFPKEPSLPVLLFEEKQFRDYRSFYIYKRARALVYTEMTPILMPRDIEARRDGFPLYWAVAAGDLVKVKVLLRLHGDPNATPTSEWMGAGYTPLSCAVRDGHTEIAKLLLAAGADTQACGTEYAVELALISGHLETAELLLSRAHTALPQPAKLELHVAAAAGKIDRVENLLGKDPGLLGASGEVTALHLAARYGRNDVVKVLLARGADPNATSPSGETPAFWAAGEGHTDTARLILQGGGRESVLIAAAMGDVAKVEEMLADNPYLANTKVGLWETPLFLASKHGHIDVVRVLLSKGALVSGGATRGFTAIHEAAHCGHLEVTRALIENGADVNRDDGSGFTPLRYAVWSGSAELVRMLIEKGADIEAGADPGEGTALHSAAADGRTDVVAVLLRAGANPNAKTEKGSTPLHHAAANGSLGAAKLLIEHGANVRAEDNGGWTALECAAEACHREMYDFLKEHGAKE